jgi:acetyl esterase/lipase
MPSVRSRFIKQFVRLRIKPLLRPGVPVRKVRGRTNYLASYGWYPFLVRRERFHVGEIDVAAYSPKTGSPRGTILFLHGGGYCFGSIRMYADLAARLAAAAHARVVLPDYRLAPEHRYPAAHDDALRVYESLLADGGCQRSLAIAGDSAGGGLTLATVLTVRDRGLPLPAAMGVISPWIDLACNGPTYATNAARDPMLPTEIMSRCAQQYAGDHDVRDPQLSPLYADLSGLPPLLIQVGTEEILQSDSTRLADAARNAGLDVTLQTYDGMWHVWQLFAWAVPEGKTAIRELGGFLRQAMDRSAAAAEPVRPRAAVGGRQPG